MYMHTNLVCIESETSDVEGASNPTKPLRRRGRAQEGSSDLVAGRLLIVLLCTCTLTLCVHVYTVHVHTVDTKTSSIDGLESLPQPVKFQGNRYKGIATHY